MGSSGSNSKRRLRPHEKRKVLDWRLPAFCFHGSFVKGSVWSFDIRYEFDTISNEYLFKMFIESADTNRSGTFKNYYKIK